MSRPKSDEQLVERPNDLYKETAVEEDVGGRVRRREATAADLTPCNITPCKLRACKVGGAAAKLVAIRAVAKLTATSL
jgi:hypothetical protein